MSYSSSRSSKLMRYLASLQAGITMFALIAMSSPLMVMAQEETLTPETESTEVVEEETGEEEESLLQTALEDLLILAGKDKDKDKKDDDEDDDEDEDEDEDDEDDKDKVEICHVTPSQTMVLEVNENGWNGHDGHDSDFLIETEEQEEWCESDKIRVVKEIEGGTATSSDFSFTVTETEDGDDSSDSETYEFDEDGEVFVLASDDDDKTYDVTEVDPGSNYNVSYESCTDISFYNDDDEEYDLESQGNDEDDEDDEDDKGKIKTCTITNTYEAPEEPTTCESGVELLENGDFESPNVSSGGWNLFASGTGGLSWIVDWIGASVSGRPLVANIEIQDGVNGWTATSTGSQWVELDSDWSTSSTGNPSATVISQDIETVVGETYTFSFDVSARPGTNANDNALDVVAGGVTLGTVGPITPAVGTAWSHEVFSFEATSTVTRVSLRDAGSSNNSFGALVDNASLTCDAPEEPEPTANLHAVKIVCDDESYLPNWGDHMDDENQTVSITANTATAFLAEVNAGREVPVCRLAPDWQFQWTTNTQSSTNPGNNLGVAGTPWVTTDETDGNGSVVVDVPVGDKIWVREVLKENYIPFTGQYASAEYSESAEIYCATDVLNYDNWDWIDPVEADEDYYCVAFNAPEPETPPAPTEATVSATKIVCDSEEFLPNGGQIANPITAGTAAAWVAQSDGKCHVQSGYDFQWAPNGTSDPEDNGTTPLGTPWVTFGSTNAQGVATTSVTVADVSGVIQVREVLKAGDVPYASDETGAKLYCASDVAGVDNWEWISNPVAGQTYHCVAFNAPSPDSGPDKVHIYKYLKSGEVTAQVADNSTAPSFPMVATWQAGNLSGGATSSGAYVLGNQHGGAAFKYAADTSPMDNGSYYTTSEVTGGDSVVVPTEGQCSPGKYRLLGYKSGTTLVNAESAPISLTAPEFFNITSDKYVIVVNEACPGDNGGGGDNDGTVVIVKHSIGGDGTFAFDLSEQLVYGTVVLPDATINTDDGYGTSTLIVEPGTYNLTEYLQEGWTLQSVTCEYDGESEGTTITNGKTIYVGANDTVTCTFTNTADEVAIQDDDNDGGGNSTGNRVRSSGNTGGLVLGASTECSPLLMTYLGKSFINAPTEVTKLQNFLNGEMDMALPLSGAFDAQTEEAVHSFQIKYWEDVLKPWFGLPGSPIQDSDDSSGIVFKTTKWKINDLFCPGSEAMPMLP